MNIFFRTKSRSNEKISKRRRRVFRVGLISTWSRTFLHLLPLRFPLPIGSQSDTRYTKYRSMPWLIFSAGLFLSDAQSHCANPYRDAIPIRDRVRRKNYTAEPAFKLYTHILCRGSFCFAAISLSRCVSQGIATPIASKRNSFSLTVLSCKKFTTAGSRTRESNDLSRIPIEIPIRSTQLKRNEILCRRHCWIQ